MAALNFSVYAVVQAFKIERDTLLRVSMLSFLQSEQQPDQKSDYKLTKRITLKDQQPLYCYTFYLLDVILLNLSRATVEFIYSGGAPRQYSDPNLNKDD